MGYLDGLHFVNSSEPRSHLECYGNSFMVEDDGKVHGLAVFESHPVDYPASVFRAFGANGRVASAPFVTLNGGDDVSFGRSYMWVENWDAKTGKTKPRRPYLEARYDWDTVLNVKSPNYYGESSASGFAYTSQKVNISNNPATETLRMVAKGQFTLYTPPNVDEPGGEFAKTYAKLRFGSSLMEVNWYPDESYWVVSGYLQDSSGDIQSADAIWVPEGGNRVVSSVFKMYETVVGTQKVTMEAAIGEPNQIVSGGVKAKGRPSTNKEYDGDGWCYLLFDTVY